MKKLVFLLLLAAATPSFSQTPDAPETAAVATIGAALPTIWEFVPDFLHNQSRISWKAPNTLDNNELFVTTTNGAGLTTGETVKLLGNNNRNWGTITATFDKKGKLKDQVMNGLLGETSLGNSDSGAEMAPAAVAVKTTAKKGLLAKRTFTLKFPEMTGILVCEYDARGRRQRDILSANGAIRTINYVYDARGLRQISDGATTTIIERDADGNVRSMSAMQNGLLTRSATPIKDSKGNLLGTRIEDYQNGILQEVNELTQEGGAKTSRLTENTTDTIVGGNGQQTSDRRFEYRLDLSPRTPDASGIEIRKRTVYKNTKIVMEELFRGGKLTQRRDFNENGVVAKTTTFNADGSVASEIDMSKTLFYVDGTK